MAESAREKRVLDRDEIELERALKDCRWLTEKPENQRSLLLPKPFETRYLDGKNLNIPTDLASLVRPAHL